VKTLQMTINDDSVQTANSRHINHFFDSNVGSLFDCVLKYTSPLPGARVIKLTILSLQDVSCESLPDRKSAKNHGAIHNAVNGDQR